MSTHSGAIAGNIGGHYIVRNAFVFECDHEGCEEILVSVADDLASAIDELIEGKWNVEDGYEFCSAHYQDHAPAEEEEYE